MPKLMRNLLQWLSDFISHNTSISARWKSEHSSAEYMIEKAKREDAYIRKTNFYIELSSYASVPQELLTLSEDHKEEIKEKFQFYTENFFSTTLWFLTKILSDYENADDLNNPIPIAILKLREHVNGLFRNQYPEEYNQIEAELSKVKQGIKPKAKVKCPECGSENIVSSGINWICCSCSRSFRKKLRRKKHYHKK